MISLHWGTILLEDKLTYILEGFSFVSTQISHSFSVSASLRTLLFLILLPFVNSRELVCLRQTSWRGRILPHSPLRSTMVILPWWSCPTIVLSIDAVYGLCLASSVANNPSYTTATRCSVSVVLARLPGPGCQRTCCPSMPFCRLPVLSYQWLLWLFYKGLFTLLWGYWLPELQPGQERC